ncbi:MAG: MoaD/ThiS family protein [Desulfobacterales bacterium]|nr:MoaD/ThiS family protein [Desulfobacterales bacterium]
MQCVLELFGILRDIAQTGEMVLELKAPATFRDLLRSLKTKSPSLGSLILTPGRDTLADPFMLNVNGGSVVYDLDEPLNEGDRVFLLYPVSGG